MIFLADGRSVGRSFHLAQYVLDFFVKKIEEVDIGWASAFETGIFDQIVLEERLQTVLLAHYHQLEVIE